ncbi:MAG: redoxin domain-containing protein [Pirellula sp.]|jgi:hypothetical protein|nr:redoxin domain-containing protein [Pirellula sp.]
MFAKVNALIVGVACLSTGYALAQESAPLQPGAIAPKLSVAQWVSTGGLAAKSLTNLDKDNIYVVEFWSTDCEGAEPGFLQMASLKQQYANQNVRFTMISHESAAAIQSFLKGTARTPDGQSVLYQQLASTLAIGSDPDRSEHFSYMGKENSSQLPWAFLVGREGILEWQGHPSELDFVLDAVVQGRWDRQKIERDQRLMAEIQESLAKLTKAKDWKGAIRELDRFLALTDDPRITFGLLKSKIEIYARYGNSSKEIADVVKNLFSICSEEPLFAHDVANTVYQLAIRGHLKDGNAMGIAIDGLNVAVGQIDEGSTKSGMLHTLAKLEGLVGKTEQAIAHQTQAIELADESQKPALNAFLAKLTSQASVPR